MPASTSQQAPAQEAGRPQPQTTVQGAGHPFITYAQPGCRLQYTSTGNAMGSQINNPLVAVPGYIRKFRVRVNATGGSASATLTAAADAPYNCVSLIQLYDSFGTPIIVGPGYEVLRLIPKYSGQHFLGAAGSPDNLSSFTAFGTAAGTTTAASTAAASGGNFQFQSCLPLEFVKGIGTLSGANASLLPRLQVTLNSSASLVTGTQAGFITGPTIEWDMDSEFYWLPEGVNIEPPGLGTTCQWVLQQANPTIATGSTTRVQLPRFGGYITTLIFILRDTGAAANPRVEGFPSRWRIYVDGVPLWDIRDDELRDDMLNQFAPGNFKGSNAFVNSNYGANDATTALDTGPIEMGVRVLTRKNSLAQNVLGLLDTGETFLSTSPGTLVEVEGAPWGSAGTGPYQLNVLVGLVVPTGTLVTGLPEV
jgi:hypothetical protein